MKHLGNFYIAKSMAEGAATATNTDALIMGGILGVVVIVALGIFIYEYNR